MVLGGRAQWLRESSGEEGEGKGGRTVAVEEVVGLKYGWCVFHGVLSKLGGVGADEVAGGTGCWLLQREGSVGVWDGLCG